MGAFLSLPLLFIPSCGTVLACLASTCGAATCSVLCRSCSNCQNSLLTRIAYALTFLINSILSWLMLTDWAVKKLQKLTLNSMKITCLNKDCYGFIAVHRINFALGILHLFLALLLLGVRTSRNSRAPIQNGFWGPKLIAWLSSIIICFMIPDAFFVVWGNYFALAGAVLFPLLGLILLVDLAHVWAEYCLERIEDSDSNVWRYVLVGSTFAMYAASIGMTVVMYIFFAHKGCHINQASITINLILFVIVSALSINPIVQSANPRAGLAQAAMVTVYCTYLTMSAVGMEPDDKNCNPLVRGHGTRTASTVLGAIVTFLTMAYTTTRAATYGIPNGNPYQYSRIRASHDNYSPSASSYHDLITQQPESRRKIRIAALQAAVQTGALPPTVLDDIDDNYNDDPDDENSSPSHFYASSRKRNMVDDERGGIQYNYSVFHIVFFLATTWVATLLTMNVNPQDKAGDFIAVGRTYWASWVKIISSWVCYALFAWSLTAPVMFPDRFEYLS